MSTTDEKLDALEFARALTLAADMLERDPVLGQRAYPDQGETLTIHAATPEIVREFAKRHNVDVIRPDGEDSYLYAIVGFGTGTRADVDYITSEAYKFAFSVQVTYYAAGGDS
jgi:hypothetical protein